MKKNAKLLIALGTAIASAVPAFAGEMSACNTAGACCPTGCVVSPKGNETQNITIGGHITAAARLMTVKNEIEAERNPEDAANVYVKHLRLFVNANLSEGWSALMNVGFNGVDGLRQFASYQYANSGCEENAGGTQLSKVHLDKAYVQKIWEDLTFRVGYQKVNWVAEEVMADSELKTANRSIATNFFTNLGRRTKSAATPGTGTTDSIQLVGNSFGSRHAGVFGAGEYNHFHFGAAVVNGYQGLDVMSSKQTNNLGLFANLGYDFTAYGVDAMVGVNFGYKEKGSYVEINRNSDVWGINPFLMASYKGFSLLTEFMYGSVASARYTDRKTANPWGVNIVPSYMLTDSLEVVGRFSYLNTDQMGTTMENAYGCTPNYIEKGTTNYNLASARLFNKATSWYVGLNYYMLNRAVKATLGYEFVNFKHRATAGSTPGGATALFTENDMTAHRAARVHNLQAALQLLF